MDTTIASPGRAAPKIPGLFGAALSVSAVLWLVAMTIEAAQAETPPRPAETVPYSDLDLSTAGGARVLLNRIQHAAKGVCGPEPVRSPLLPRADAHYRQCVTASVDAAVTPIGSPALLALHRDNQATNGVAVATR